jgi:hypothetical protein
MTTSLFFCRVFLLIGLIHQFGEFVFEVLLRQRAAWAAAAVQVLVLVVLVPLLLLLLGELLLIVWSI